MPAYLLAIAIGLFVGSLVYSLGNAIRHKRVGGLHFYQVGRYGATFYRKSPAQVKVPAPTPSRAVSAEIRGILATHIDERGYTYN